MSLESLGDLIGGQFKESKAETETQGLDPGTSSSLFIFSDYALQVRVTKVLIEQQSIGGDSGIWGNSTFGIWGTMKWGGAAQSSFILGSALAGVLGTSELGSNNSAYEQVEEIILTQTIPTIARNEIAKWLNSEAADNPTHLGIGTSNTPYLPSNTSLGNEIARKVVTYDISTSKQAEYTIEILSTDTTYHSDTFREVGLFNASTSGDLFARAIISDLTMNAALNTRISLVHDMSNLSVGTSLVTDDGLNQIRDWLGGVGSTALTHTAWGTGTTFPNPSDTVLEGEIERNAFVSQARNQSQITYESILAKSEGNGNTITKSGLFNAATLGTLFAESKFGGINKESLFQISQTDRLRIN